MQVLVGLVNRDNMMVIIRRALAQGHRPAASMAAEIDYEDLNRNFVSAAARHLISEQQLAVLEVLTHVLDSCDSTHLVDIRTCAWQPGQYPSC